MTLSNKNRTKICLLGASFDTCNMGVSALAEASIKCILNKWPEAEVILLGSGRSISEYRVKLMDKEFKVREVPIRFSKNIFLPNHFIVLAFYALLLKLFPSRLLRNFLMESNSHLKSILQADLFSDITGGDSFSNIYGMHRFMLGSLEKLLPIILDKELILLPQTYGPFKGVLTKFIARYILKHSSLIYCRDRAGTEYVSRLLNRSSTEDKVKFVPELAFVLDPRKPPNMDIGLPSDVRTDKSIIIGLNVSGLLYYGGYTKNNMFGLKENYAQIICRIIDLLMAKENVRVLLVPHVFPPIEYAEITAVENDVAACLDVYKKFSNKYSDKIFMVRGSYDQSQIKYIIGLCDFFIGSRMHSCVAALSQMIPAIGLAYSKKFSGVFDSVDVGDLVIDLRTETEGRVLAFVDKAFSEREVFVRRLSQTIPKAQEEILKVFSYSA